MSKMLRFFNVSIVYYFIEEKGRTKDEEIFIYYGSR